MSRLRSANSSSVEPSAIAARRWPCETGVVPRWLLADLGATAAESLEAVLAAQEENCCRNPVAVLSPQRRRLARFLRGLENARACMTLDV